MTVSGGPADTICAENKNKKIKIRQVFWLKHTYGAKTNQWDIDFFFNYTTSNYLKYRVV